MKPTPLKYFTQRCTVMCNDRLHYSGDSSFHARATYDQLIGAGEKPVYEKEHRLIEFTDFLNPETRWIPDPVAKFFTETVEFYITPRPDILTIPEEIKVYYPEYLEVLQFHIDELRAVYFVPAAQ